MTALFGVLAVLASTPVAVAPDAPGLDVEDRCMAAGLTRSGFTGAIRIRLSPQADRSLEQCDPQAAAEQVRAFKVTARPCLGMALRRHGYGGRLFTPAGMISTPEEAACEAGAAPRPATVTFRRADGVKVTTMRPIPNPEDMPAEDRRRVYGYWE